MPLAMLSKIKNAAAQVTSLKKMGEEVLNSKPAQFIQSKMSSTQSNGTTDEVKLGDSGNTSDQNITPLITNKDITNDNIEIIDADWVSSRFMVPDDDLEEVDRNNRYFSTTRWKYFDTSLGGHIAINPKPQYTRYADIRQPRGVHSSYPDVTTSEMSYKTALRSGGGGFTLGRFYSESIDDFATTIYITFGRPRFNSLLSFLTRSVSAIDIHIANTGRPPTIWYNIGKGAGYIAAHLMFPAMSTIIWAIRIGVAILNVGASSYDFYYLEESMKDYWYTVNSLVTNLGVEMGLIGGVFNSDETGDRIGATVTFDKMDLLGLTDIMGERIIDPDTGWIDIFAIVTRVQRIENDRRWAATDNWTLDMEKNFTGYIMDAHAIKNDTGKNRSFGAMVDRYLNFSSWKNRYNNSYYYASGTDGASATQLIKISNTDTTEEKSQKGANENNPNAKKDVIDLKTNTATSAIQNQTLKNAKQGDSFRTTKMEAKNVRYATPAGTFQSSDDVKRALDLYGDEYDKRAFEDNYNSTKNIETYDAQTFLLDNDKEVANKAALESRIKDYTFGPSDKPIDEEQDSFFTKALSGIDSITRDGALFAVFNVDYQGPVSESVSNSISDMALKDTMKSAARAAREINFNLAGGNVFGDAQASVTAALTDFAKGAVEGITIGLSNIVAGLMGGAYIDIPKKWDDSEISFPQITYKMKLISPYGNILSQFMDIYIPLCMLIAGSFPQAAGKRSYTSPFLCSLFNRGVQNIKLGMITSLSIERGTSNLAFDRQKRALAIDVSFTVTDFSTVVTSPMNAGVFSDLLNFESDEHAPLQRYLNVLASRDLWTELYMVPKLKNLLRKKAQQVKALLSPNQWSFRIGDPLRNVVGPFQARNITGGVNTVSANNRK